MNALNWWPIFSAALGLFAFWVGREIGAAKQRERDDLAKRGQVDVLAILATARRAAPTYDEHLQMRAAHDAVERALTALASCVDAMDRSDGERMPGIEQPCSDQEWDAALDSGRAALARVRP